MAIRTAFFRQYRNDPKPILRYWGLRVVSSPAQDEKRSCGGYHFHGLHSWVVGRCFLGAALVPARGAEDTEALLFRSAG